MSVILKREEKQYDNMHKMLENLKAGKGLGMKELEDKVRENAHNRFGINPPPGGPQRQETPETYKERLFRFLVRLVIAAAKSGEKPDIVKNLIKWLIEHSLSYAVELAKNTD
jgi:hypothetical protein